MTLSIFCEVSADAGELLGGSRPRHLEVRDLAAHRAERRVGATLYVRRVRIHEPETTAVRAPWLVVLGVCTLRDARRLVRRLGPRSSFRFTSTIAAW